MAVAEVVSGLLAPLCDELGLELVDVEHAGGVLRIAIDREGGVDLETIALLTRETSRLLDEHDPIAGHYTLEVSSPGLERNLRTPAHYQRAIGDVVKVKTHGRVEGERRSEGVLVAADDDGFELELREAPFGRRRLRYLDVERARTVFEWGPAPKPGHAPSGTRRRADADQPSTTHHKAVSP